MAKEKETVEVEPEEIEGQQTLHTPYGVQDMNAAVEVPEIGDGIDTDVTRLLTDEVHVDMGRGALTFKPGDTIVIRDGHIRKATTREGMEYEFRPAHEVAKERFDQDQEAAGKHLASGQARDDQTAPSQPQDPVTEEMPAANPVDDAPQHEPGTDPQPERGKDDPERTGGSSKPSEQQPREKGKFARKDD